MMIRKFLEVNHLKQVDLVRYLDQSASFVSQIVKGTRPIPEDSLNKLLNNNEGWDTSMLAKEGGPYAGLIRSKANIIPLLPFSAVAGYMSDNNGADLFRGESVMFADFTDRGADCAIRVDGDSMWPRYNNGDILAIRIVEPTFFQWGRVYVLSTTQGCVIKRLFPDKENPENIICRSENSENYPDYSIPKSEVISVAIVVGHAGIE